MSTALNLNVNHQLLANMSSRLERAFRHTANGTLKSDKETRDLIEAFCNDPTNRIVCELVTGVPMNIVKFEDPYMGDIATTNRNKILAQRLYGVWFVFYARLCATIHRQMAANLLPPPVVVPN